MDQIVQGFLRQIGRLITYQSVVLHIQLLEDGVEVTYRGPRGRTFRTRADYCISNIPLPVLQKIPANFSSDFKKAVDRGRFDPTCKAGWQANARFWESDTYQIYGGISFIDHLITQMWYPSFGYFTGKGTLTGAYNFDRRALQFGKMSLEQRLMVARAGAIKLHPEFGHDAVTGRCRTLPVGQVPDALSQRLQADRVCGRHRFSLPDSAALASHEQTVPSAAVSHTSAAHSAIRRS